MIDANDQKSPPRKPGNKVFLARIHLGQTLLKILWRRRWIVLATTALALVSAGIYLLEITPSYTAKSLVKVRYRQAQHQADPLRWMGVSRIDLLAQCALMRSGPVLAPVLDRSDVASMRTFEQIDNPFAFLRENLKVRVEGKDNQLVVSFIAPDPLEAAMIVNHVVESYCTFHRDQKEATAAEVLSILQSERASHETQLKDKIEQLLHLKQEHAVLLTETDGRSLVLDQLGVLTSALKDAELATRRAEALAQTVQWVGENPQRIQQLRESKSDQTTDEQITPGSDRVTELSVLDANLAELAAINHPDVEMIEQVRARIARIDRQIASHEQDGIDGLVGQIDEELNDARWHEHEMRATLEKQKKRAKDLQVVAREMEMLRRDVKRGQRMIGILDNQVKDLVGAENLGGWNPSIIEEAKASSVQMSPRGARIMVIALALGTLLGGVLALFVTHFDQHFSSPDEVNAMLGAPVLGLVPRMSSNGTMQLRGLEAAMGLYSPVAEAYRVIRSAVYFGAPFDAGKILLVTSPLRQEGKSTLVSNLAVTMAQAGQRALIVDADYRRPVQHEIFQVSNEEGLSNCLTSTDCWTSVVQQTGIVGLDLLPCGQMLANSSELLNSQRFVDLLEELSVRYDQIILDSPSVLPVTDSRIFLASSSLTILVLRAECSKRKEAVEATELLSGVGARVLGVVLNAVNHRFVQKGVFATATHGRDGLGKPETFVGSEIEPGFSVHRA